MSLSLVYKAWMKRVKIGKETSHYGRTAGDYVGKFKENRDLQRDHWFTTDDHRWLEERWPCQ